MNYKRLALIVVFILVVFGVAFILYFFFFKPLPPPQEITPPAEEEPTARLPEGPVAPGIPPAVAPVEAPPQVRPIASEIAQGGLTASEAITKESATEPVLGKDGKFHYYHFSSGRFYSLTPDGQIKTLLSTNFFPQIKEVQWSPIKEEAILTFPDGSNVFYDFAEKKQVTLPKNWYDFGFSSQGDRVALKINNLNPDKRWLAISNPDGSEVRAIEPIGEKGRQVQVAWSPTGEVIAFFTKTIGLNRQEVFFVGQHGENFRSMYVEGLGFKGKWSPSGTHILYSSYSTDLEDGMKPSLWIVEGRGDDIGRNRTNLGVNTWVDKCIFTSDSQKVYCAAPRELPVGAGPAPDLALGYPDDFYSIDLRTGLKTFLAQPEGNFNAQRLMLSDDERYLYFSDRMTGQIQQIRLR